MRCVKIVAVPLLLQQLLLSLLCCSTVHSAPHQKSDVNSSPSLFFVPEIGPKPASSVTFDDGGEKKNLAELRRPYSFQDENVHVKLPSEFFALQGSSERILDVKGQRVSEEVNINLENIPQGFLSEDSVSNEFAASWQFGAKPLSESDGEFSSFPGASALSRKLAKFKDVLRSMSSAKSKNADVTRTQDALEAATSTSSSSSSSSSLSSLTEELAHAVTNSIHQRGQQQQQQSRGRGGDDDHLTLSSYVTCDVCTVGVTLARVLVERNATADEIVELATELCHKLGVSTERVCQGIITEFAPMVLTVVDELVLTPAEICGLLVGPTCGTPYNPWHPWNVTLPTVPQPPPVYPTPPKAGSPTFRVLHLTDVHYDAAYKPGSNAVCQEFLCCRADSGPVTNQSQAACKFGDYRNCDTPLWTLENLFSRLAAEKGSFEYIIWTGDLPAHNVWEQPREAQLASLRSVVSLILKYFPDTPVYPSLGNHESSPVNSFPPPYIKGANSISWLYDALADSWKHWLPASAIETVKKGAYYTVSPHKGFRVISLNMNYCNNENWWMLLNTTDPAQELQWLIQTLQAAEDAGEKVHILGHIPPGITDCLRTWSWNYYRIVSRYQNTISGQFFGHTHTDSFEVFYDVETLKIPVSVAYVAPSVTSYSGLNMGYRFYTVDGFYANSSYQILDHSTYILDLERAHREGNITWEFEYSAKAAYNMSSVYPKDWDRLIEVMKKNSTVLQLYNKYYRKSRGSGTCNAICRLQRLCEARSGRSHDPSLCRDLNVKDESYIAELMRTTPRFC